MNKRAFKVLSLLAMNIAALHGAQQTQQVFSAASSAVASAQQAEQEYRVITGDVYMYSSFIYAGYRNEFKKDIFDRIEEHICDINGNPIKLNPADKLTSLHVRSDESENWSCRLHCRLGRLFPSMLPVSFFEGKKEGEMVTFFFKAVKDPYFPDLVFQDGKDEETFKIVLTCRQKMYHGIAFETQFAIRLQKFLKEPDYWASDKEQLIKDGILVEKDSSSSTSSSSAFEPTPNMSDCSIS